MKKPDKQAIQTVTDLFYEKVNSQFSIQHLLLFGSYARGEERSESDIDIAVLLDGPTGDYFGDKLKMDDIAYDILLETGMRIQPLPLWQDEWQHPERYSNPYLIKNIKKEGIVL